MAELILEINNNKTSWNGVKFPFYIIFKGRRYKFISTEFGCLEIQRDDKNKKKFANNKNYTILADKE